MISLPIIFIESHKIIEEYRHQEKEGEEVLGSVAAKSFTPIAKDNLLAALVAQEILFLQLIIYDHMDYFNFLLWHWPLMQFPCMTSLSNQKMQLL